MSVFVHNNGTAEVNPGTPNAYIVLSGEDRMRRLLRCLDESVYAFDLQAAPPVVRHLFCPNDDPPKALCGDPTAQPLGYTYAALPVCGQCAAAPACHCGFVDEIAPIRNEEVPYA